MRFQNEKVSFSAAPGKSREEGRKFSFPAKPQKKGLKCPAEYSIITKSPLNIIPHVSHTKMEGEHFMREFFGTLPSGETASLYTISCGRLSAAVSDYGATLVRLLVPGQDGTLADVVLGYDDCNGYR